MGEPCCSTPRWPILVHNSFIVYKHALSLMAYCSLFGAMFQKHTDIGWHLYSLFAHHCVNKASTISYACLQSACWSERANITDECPQHLDACLVSWSDVSKVTFFPCTQVLTVLLSMHHLTVLWCKFNRPKLCVCCFFVVSFCFSLVLFCKEGASHTGILNFSPIQVGQFMRRSMNKNLFVLQNII